MEMLTLNNSTLKELISELLHFQTPMGSNLTSMQYRKLKKKKHLNDLQTKE